MDRYWISHPARDLSRWFSRFCQYSYFWHFAPDAQGSETHRAKMDWHSELRSGAPKAEVVLHSALSSVQSSVGGTPAMRSMIVIDVRSKRMFSGNASAAQMTSVLYSGSIAAG